MSNIQLKVKQLFSNQDLVEKMRATMTPQKQEMFKTSILSIIATSQSWENVDPVSIMSAALVSATLDLPINPNLGFSYIIPYKDQAQFQIGYKGIIQLAIRSGQYKSISVAPVFEGQLIENDPLKGMVFDWKVEGKGEPIGYVSYFALINGFEKYLYMSKKQLEAHGLKFSQTYKSEKKWIKDKSLWTTDFDSMASKTVLKLLLSKFGILSVELQKAIISDQAIIDKNGDVEYIDNNENVIDVEDKKNEILEKLKITETVAKTPKTTDQVDPFSKPDTIPETSDGSLIEDKIPATNV